MDEEFAGDIWDLKIYGYKTGRKCVRRSGFANGNFPRLPTVFQFGFYRKKSVYAASRSGVMARLSGAFGWRLSAFFVASGGVPGIFVYILCLAYLIYTYIIIFFNSFVANLRLLGISGLHGK